jgi:DNA topoisomerase-1
VNRLAIFARANGAAFDPWRFSAVRERMGAQGLLHAHESPNAMQLTVSINRGLGMMGLEDQVLTLITRHLIDCGSAARLDIPSTHTLAPQAQGLPWMRLRPLVERLWQEPAPLAQVQRWTPEQSLLHFMSANGLGRPSTINTHIDKFLTRGLVTQAFDLTDKGLKWEAKVRAILGSEKLSSEVEKFIENHKSSPPEMVARMLELFELREVQHVARTAQAEHPEHQHEAIEIPAWDIS